MQKRLKIITLFMLIFVGMSGVSAKTCVMKGVYQKSKNNIRNSQSNAQPYSHEGASCNDSREYYYKINVEGGKAEISEYWYCQTDETQTVKTWTKTDKVNINGELKYDLHNNEVDCGTIKVCRYVDDDQNHIITSDCGNKDLDKSTEATEGNGNNSNGSTAVNLCDGSSETIKLAKEVYTFLRFTIPILVIVLSVIDFLKVTINGDEKVYAEAWNKFIKRLIIGVVILLVPVLIKLLLDISGITNTYGNSMFCIFE